MTIRQPFLRRVKLGTFFTLAGAFTATAAFAQVPSISGAAQNAVEQTGNAARRTGETLSGATNRAAQGARQTGEAVRDLGRGVQDGVRRSGEVVRDLGRNAENTVRSGDVRADARVNVQDGQGRQGEVYLDGDVQDGVRANAGANYQDSNRNDADSWNQSDNPPPSPINGNAASNGWNGRQSSNNNQWHGGNPNHYGSAARIQSNRVYRLRYDAQGREYICVCGRRVYFDSSNNANAHTQSDSHWGQGRQPTRSDDSAEDAAENRSDSAARDSDGGESERVTDSPSDASRTVNRIDADGADDGNSNRLDGDASVDANSPTGDVEANAESADVSADVDASANDGLDASGEVDASEAGSVEVEGDVDL